LTKIDKTKDAVCVSTDFVKCAGFTRHTHLAMCILPSWLQMFYLLFPV